MRTTPSHFISQAPLETWAPTVKSAKKWRWVSAPSTPAPRALEIKYTSTELPLNPNTCTYAAGKQQQFDARNEQLSIQYKGTLFRPPLATPGALTGIHLGATGAALLIIGTRGELAIRGALPRILCRSNRSYSSRKNVRLGVRRSVYLLFTRLAAQQCVTLQQGEADVVVLAQTR